MISQQFPEDQDIGHYMLVDRYQFQRRLRSLKKRKKEGRSFSEGLLRLLADMERSKVLADQRRQLLPDLYFPAELPICAHLDEIRELIKDRPVVVLCGETGSGKSTQLPKICLSLGRGVYGRIGHTQPRRIAARSLASRIATELNSATASEFGWIV